MTVKIKKSGSYISKVNGIPLINNQYALDINSDRKNNNQVISMVNNNGIIERKHDSFQNYMNKMSSKNQSIFDLLKSERNEINKIPNISNISNISNIVMKVVDSPSKPSMLSIPTKISNTINNIKQKTKKRVTSHNGISSKLFDFTNIAPNPDPLPNSLPNIGHNHSRKKRRKRSTRKNRKNKKKL